MLIIKNVFSLTRIIDRMYKFSEKNHIQQTYCGSIAGALSIFLYVPSETFKTRA